MAISFNTIPLTVNTPGLFAEFDSSRAAKGLAPIPHVVLVTGQMLTGSAVAGVPVLVETKESAGVLFDAKSQIAQTVVAYKAVDPLTELWAIPLADDSGGAAATGSITLTGTSTEAGEVAIYVGGRRIAVAVPVGMTAAQFETAAVAAFGSAALSDLPVSAAADAGTGVDFTARHKGTAGNGIQLGVALAPGERTPAGFTFTVTAMSGGATDPDYAAVVTAMADDWYNTIVMANNASTQVAKLVTEMEDRWGAMRSIEGQIFIAKADSQANLTTAGNGYNSLALSLVGHEVSALSPLPWEVAARAAAADVIVTKSDPALPRTGVALSCLAAHRGARFKRSQQDILLTDGVSTVLAASDGRMNIQRLITTYQTNGASVPDQAYMDIMSVRTLAALRYTVKARIALKFARTKLMDDPTSNTIKIPDNTVTPSIVKAEILAWYKECLEDRGWVEDFDTFAAQLRVERDVSDPDRLNMFIPADLMNSFLVGAMKIAFTR